MARRRPDEQRSLTGRGGFLARLLDRNIAVRWPNYVFQCGLATVSLVAILLVGNEVFGAAIVVAVASTAFTVFVIPNSIASSPRLVIGGHVVAVLVSGAFSIVLILLTHVITAADSQLFVDIIAALSVGFAIFLMVATDTQHPPAAGTVLGLVINGWNWPAVAFILISAIVLIILRIVLGSKLINLL